MTTKSNYAGMGDIDFNQIHTNKGAKPVAVTVPKKCVKCDETVLTEEVCPRCHRLTEDAKIILTD